MPKKQADALDEITSHAEAMERDLREAKLQKEKRSTDARYRLLRDRVAELEAELEAVKQIKDTDVYEIRPHKGHDGEATAVALASDFHAEETVDPRTVNGLNEYTLDIAADRFNRFFVNVARLIAAKKKSVSVKTLVLALLGDFITGNIHDELIESASLAPIEAAIFVKNHLASGIRYLLDNTDVEIILPCHSGNHARITKKQRHGTERGNSLEYFIYHFLADYFRAEKRVTFVVAPGYHSKIDVQGFVIRFHHGHAIKFWGGVGGITIPVRKAISQWNKSGPVDADCFGHFHQLLYGGNFICNGAGIGYNAFALSIKADFEKPRQAFFLVNHRRKEVTDFSPVWLD